MKLNREVTGIVLALVGFPAIYFGGIYFFAVFTFFLVLAGWEMGRLYRPLEITSSDAITVLGILAILTTRFFLPELASVTLAISILAAMAYHLVSYERGRDHAGTDFAITAAAIVYLGWVGGYLGDLRNLSDNWGWFLLVLFPVWIGDTSAYYIGKRFGKHKMTPRLSPKKSWEGYIASVIGGGLAGLLVGMGMNAAGWLDVPLYHALVIGLLSGALPTLGDLGESMIKRQAGLKDAGSIMPGHGGAFDRIDSWLWAGVIGFIYITLVIL